MELESTHVPSDSTNLEVGGWSSDRCRLSLGDCIALSIIQSGFILYLRAAGTRKAELDYSESPDTVPASCDLRENAICVSRVIETCRSSSLGLQEGAVDGNPMDDDLDRADYGIASVVDVGDCERGGPCCGQSCLDAHHKTALRDSSGRSGERAEGH